MKTTKTDIALAVGLMIAFLVFAGWVVSRRIGDIDLPARSGDVASFSNSSLNLPDGAPDIIQDDMLPVLSKGMPEFQGIEAWLNSSPLTQEELRGKVVMIDFWTYSCINCIRTLPYVTSWYDKYEDDGFVIIGVHTPEFAFEKERENVEEAIAEHGIRYPVAQDNDYDTWDAYNNRYWPAHYLFDAEGRLRYTHFGEGEYDKTESNIVALLKEAGYDPDEEMTEVGDLPDFRRIGTPETYLGYWRMEGNGNAEPLLRDEPQVYTVPEEPEFNRFYFQGQWSVMRQHSQLESEGGAIVYRYRASNVNLVMGSSSGDPVLARVYIDGEEMGVFNVLEETLYELHSTPGSYDEHVLRIEFLDPGVEVYAFTFG